ASPVQQTCRVARSRTRPGFCTPRPEGNAQRTTAASKGSSYSFCLLTVFHSGWSTPGRMETTSECSAFSSPATQFNQFWHLRCKAHKGEPIMRQLWLIVLLGLVLNTPGCGASSALRDVTAEERAKAFAWFG